MLVLGIDTATPVTSVAVGSEQGIRASTSIRRERGHAGVLMPAVRWVLDQAGVQSGSLGGVAVGIGPGLFSGLRVGVSSAKALAQALGCPMVPVPSLDLLAFANRHAHHDVWAVIDGRRGEVFAALYLQAPGWMLRVSGFHTVRPDQLAAAIEARDAHALLVGDGALAYREVFDRIDGVDLASPAQAPPSAEALVELAVPRFEREEFVQPLKVTPLYLRKPDVDPSAERLASGGATESLVV